MVAHAEERKKVAKPGSWNIDVVFSNLGSWYQYLVEQMACRKWLKPQEGVGLELCATNPRFLGLGDEMDALRQELELN